jgi:hypothetical protein
VRPIVFAVLRLIRSSNLVGRSTGMSAGFAPLRIFDKTSSAAELLGSAHRIGHKRANHDRFSVGKNRGDSLLKREVSDELSFCVNRGVVRNEKCVRPVPSDYGEGVGIVNGGMFRKSQRHTQHHRRVPNCLRRRAFPNFLHPEKGDADRFRNGFLEEL